MPMQNPSHPGGLVKYECMEYLGLSVERTAEGLGVTAQELLDVIDERAGISADLAVRLSIAFGSTPEVWLGMQTAYDLWHAKERAKGIEVERFAPPYSPLEADSDCEGGGRAYPVSAGDTMADGFRELPPGGKMSDWALFINGIFEGVLGDMATEHSRNPERTLFLQPFTGGVIKRLKDNIPSPEVPVTLYASITTDLHNICYQGEVVGWEDKEGITADRIQELEAIFVQYQPTEQGNDQDGLGIPRNPGRNLIHVRRMVKLEAPFSVGELIKLSDGKPLSTNRTRAGGYSYVRKAG